MDGPAIAATVERLRRTFDAGTTRPLSWRRAQLEAIVRMLDEGSDSILAALRADLGKSELESFSGEISFVAQEAKRTLAQLRGWTRAESVRTTLLAQPGRSRIVREPLGVVLIIAPWNFPLQLALGPLVGAIAAGNCALIKPSELSSHTSKLIAELVERYLDHDAFAVVEGAVPETTALLEQRFDHIFFTGSPRIGRVVMMAAAQHLTPVTLELGGKCPCIVDRHANLRVAARRICWGKFTNAGQICLAPDYLLVHDEVYDPFVELLRATVREFFGEDPQHSADYGRIIDVRHVRRLAKLLEGETLVIGGQIDEDQRYIAPTIIRDVSEDSALMQEEIFGPLLPVLRIGDIDASISFVNARPKPLALYVFTQDKRASKAVIERTSSGGASINHTWLFASIPSLPFGGVGESGMGAYHGRHSFETFSHHKAVLEKGTGVDPDLIYPPYTDSKKKWIKRFL